MQKQSPIEEKKILGEISIIYFKIRFPFSYDYKKKSLANKAKFVC